MELIKNLEWRYATKKFDSQRKVNAEDLEKVKKVVQLSASSYGLQLYKVLVIEDMDLRRKLKAASWEQPQITDASHLIVFCNYAEIQDQNIDDHLQLIVNTQGASLEDVQDYGNLMKQSLATRSTEEKQIWTARQTYLALGNLLAACAELKIDACPMEGFDPQQYNEILGLSEKGLNAAVIATIGYRSPEDEYQHKQKVRKPVESLFETI